MSVKNSTATARKPAANAPNYYDAIKLANDVITAVSTDLSRKPRIDTIHTLIEMSFRWMSISTDPKVPSRSPAKDTEAQKARSECGAELFRLVGEQPIDATRAVQDEKLAQAAHERTIVDIADRALAHLDEVWKRVERLNVLAKKIDRHEDGTEELATIVVDLTTVWSNEYLDQHGILKLQLDKALGRAA